MKSLADFGISLDELGITEKPDTGSTPSLADFGISLDELGITKPEPPKAEQPPEYSGPLPPPPSRPQGPLSPSQRPFEQVTIPMAPYSQRPKSEPVESVRMQPVEITKYTPKEEELYLPTPMPTITPMPGYPGGAQVTSPPSVLTAREKALKATEPALSAGGGMLAQAGKKLQAPEPQGPEEVARINRGREIAMDIPGFDETSVKFNDASLFSKAGPLERADKEALSSYLFDVQRRKKAGLGKAEQKIGEAAVGAATEVMPPEIKEAKISERLDLIAKDSPGLARSLRRGDVGGAIDFFTIQAAMSGNEEAIDRALRLKKEYGTLYAGQEEEVKRDIEAKTGPAKTAAQLKNVVNQAAEMAPLMAKSIALDAIPVVGSTLSSSMWAAQGAGDMYSMMREQGVPHDIALESAIGTGLIYALIERAQVKQIANIGKLNPIKQGLAKRILKYGAERGWDYVKENLEEIAQGYVQGNTVGNAMVMAGASREEANKVAADIANPVETLKGTLGPMAVLNVPASLFGFGRLVRSGRKPSPGRAAPTGPAQALPPTPGTSPEGGQNGLQQPEQKAQEEVTFEQKPAPGALPVPAAPSSPVEGKYQELSDYGLSPEEFIALPDERRGEIWDTLNPEAKDALLSFEPKKSVPETKPPISETIPPISETIPPKTEENRFAANQPPPPDQTTGLPLSTGTGGAVESQPTAAQKEAGNYKKAHVRRDGLDISIENPAGSVRSGTDSDGETWSQTMNHDYGYIKGTTGRDKDHVDVFIDPGSEEGGNVFVIDQVNPKTGKFDEHKVMMGFDSELGARSAYLSNYEKGWKGIGAITPLSMDEFKKWVFSNKTKKPLGTIQEVPAATEAKALPAVPTEQPAQPETAPAVPETGSTAENAVTDLFNKGYTNITKVRRGKTDYYRVYDNLENEKLFKADDLVVPFIRNNPPKDVLPLQSLKSIGQPLTDEQKAQVDNVVNSGFKYAKLVMKKGKENKRAVLRQVWKVYDDAGRARYVPEEQTGVINYFKARVKGEQPAAQETPVPAAAPPVPTEQPAQPAKESAPPPAPAAEKQQPPVAKEEKATAPAPEEKKPETPAESKKAKARKVFDELQRKRLERENAKPGEAMADIKKKRDEHLQSAQKNLAKLLKSFEERDPNTFYMAGTEQAQIAFDLVSDLVMAGYYEFQTLMMKIAEMAREKAQTKGFKEAIQDAYDAYANVDDTIKKRPETETADTVLGTGEKEPSVSAPEAKPRELDKRFLDEDYRNENPKEAYMQAVEYAKSLEPTHTIDTPERKAKRKAIVDELYGDGAKNKTRKATILIGLPASGKSTVAEKIQKETGALVVDNDMIKAKMDEYENGAGAWRLHEESSDVLDTLLYPRAVAAGDDIILPVLGKTLLTLRARIDNLLDNKYSVKVVFVKVPAEVSMERAIARFIKTGRVVNVEDLSSKALKINENYGILKEDGKVEYEQINGESGESEESGGKPPEGDEQARGVGPRRGPGRRENGETVEGEGVTNGADRGRKTELAGREPEAVPETGERGQTRAAPSGEGAEGGGEGRGVGGGRNRLSDREGDRAPESIPAAGRDQRDPAEDNARDTALRNYLITDADNLGAGGPKQKFRDNIAAIRTLKEIEAAGRRATPEEQAILVKYIGWGMFPQVFVKGDAVDPKWKKEAAELRELLTEDEFRAANRSILNAHFSHTTVIRSMWNAVRRMGFSGGKVIEPAVGIGHFFGLRPGDLNYSMTAVELDSLSGRITKELYQKADVRIQGYETVPLIENHYDLFISNVPFWDGKPFDPDSKKYGIKPRSMALHDFYFIKSLYGTRPGGIVAFITSRYTMDKGDSTVRRKMAETADFVGAIRLPNTAFKGNAGTEVVTDIIFLQKRAAGEPMSELTKEFLSLAPIELKNEKGEKSSVNTNKYYHSHPEMIVGKQSLEGSMYSENEYTVYLNADKIGGVLNAAVEKLPAGIMSAVEQNEEKMTEDMAVVFAPDHIATGSYFLLNNKIYMKMNASGRSVEQKLSPEEHSRVRALVSFKNIFKQVFRNQLKKTGNREADIKRLNAVYDAFLKRYGAVHEKKNIIFIDQDAELAGLLALEKWNNETKTATKSKYLQGKIAVDREAAVKVESTEDAYLATLAKTGSIDWNMMKEISGKDIAQIQKELVDKKIIFLDHESVKNGEEVFLTREEYLSGDVRKKLREARELAKTDNRLERNVEELLKVQPPLKGPGQITIGVNSPVLDTKDIADFANAMFSRSPESRNITVFHDSLSGKYTVRVDDKKGRNNTDKWGVNYSTDVIGGEGFLAWYGTDILDAVLNNSNLSVRYNTGTAQEPAFVVDEKATVVLREKADMLKDEFKRWVWRDTERANRLVAVYNDVFNNIAERQYIHPVRVKNPDDRVKLYGGTFMLRANQADAIWRVIQEQNTMLAHGVGAGKTAIMAGAAMELRRLGIRKKNLLVVPNHMIPQWQTSILIQYPGARVLTATTTNFDDKTARREFLNKAAIGDYDLVLMRYSHFKMISMSPEVQTEFVNDRMAQYKEALERVLEAEAQEAQGQRRKKRSKTRAQKYLESRILKMEERLKELVSMKKDTGFPYFDEMGFDQMFVDEADNFKNLDFASAIQNVLGMGSPAGSEQALDMHMKVRFIQRQGGGITFATGTPISNTLAEAYHMMRFLQPEELEKRNLGCFDEWQRMFAEPVTQWELNASGTGLKQRTRFAKFNNVQELARILRQSWDVMTAQMLEDRKILRRGHELPRVKREIIESNVTPLLSEYLDHLGAREQAIENRKGPPEKGDDIHLAVISHGKLASIDMRLIHPTLPDESTSKLNSVINRVFQLHRDYPGTAGVIFYDMTRPRAPGERMFDVYADIKKKLVEMGVPAREIAFIHDYNTDAKKLQLFSDVNTARVRILIGNTPKLGAGTNIQHLLKWLVHVDGPNRPRDVTQREGRIIRQGNENKEVVVATAISKGSHDQSVWEMLQRKARMIDDVISGEDKGTDQIEEDDPFAEASIAAIGTPLMKQRAEAKAEVKRLTALIENKQNEQFVARDKIEFNDRLIGEYKEKVRERTALLSGVKEAPEENQTRITTNDGKEIKKREAANKAIVEWFNENKNSSWYRYNRAFKVDNIEVAIQMTADDRINIELSYDNESVNIDGPGQPVLILSTVEKWIWDRKGDIAWLKNRIGILGKENDEHKDLLKENTDELGKELSRQKSNLKRIEADIAEEAKKKAEEKSQRATSGYDFGELEADRKRLANDKNDEKEPGDSEKDAIREAKKRYQQEQEEEGPVPAMLKPEQIFTPEFKKWFGDWENDPKNASKVVDAEGKPLVVYHGTKENKIDTFDINLTGTGRGRRVNIEDEPTIYFTSELEDAEEYGIPIPVYLSIKKPYIVDAYNQMEEWRASEFDDTYGDVQEMLEKEYGGDLQKAWQYDDVLYDAIAHARKNGFDGAIVKWGGIESANRMVGDNYMIISPTQIKSATGNRGTFDPENPDIRFLRNTTKAATIRESLKEAIVGNIDKVLANLPAGTGENIEINITPEFEVRGRKFGEDGNWEAAVWYNPQGKVIEIYINPDIPSNRIATALTHELPGHIGSRLVYADNIAIYRKMKALFEQEREAGAVDIKGLERRYKDEIAAAGARGDEVLFDEWTAHHLTRYQAGNRDGITARVYNFFRDILVSLGIAKENLNDVLRSMVKEMRRAPLEKLGAGRASFMREWEIAEQGGNIDLRPGQEGKLPQKADLAEIYQTAREKRPDLYKTLFGKEKELKRTKDRLAADLLVPISTRLKHIGPQFKDALRKFEFAIRKAEHRDTMAVKPFLEGLKKMDPGDRRVLDIALKNADPVEVGKIVTKYNLQDQYAKVRETLNDIRWRALNTGLNINYVREYWPRIVVNPEGLLNYAMGLENWHVIEQEIKSIEDERGRPLSEKEKADVANRFIGKKEQIVDAPGSLKARAIEVIDTDLDRFYDYSPSALLTYLHEMNNTIELRKFLGIDKLAKKARESGREEGETDKQGKPLNSRLTDVDGGIGAYVIEAREKHKLNDEQLDELVGILRARFNFMPTKGLAEIVRNTGYITAMGSGWSSFITQIGDLSWAFYVAGPIKALKSTAKAFVGKSDIKKEDLGLERIAEEFRSVSGMGRAVEKIFKWTLLNRMDNIGKEALINGYLDRMQKQAREKNPALMSELKRVFGEGGYSEVVGDLVNKRNTDDVKYLLFSRLLDFQPMAQSEMPIGYLKSPKGRILYMLKTFTIKQLDVFRNEGIDLIAAGLKAGDKGQVVRGVRNLVYLAALFIAANATADAIKDWLFDRHPTFSDWVWDNILRLGGMSRFVVWETRRAGPVQALWKLISPPLDVVEAPLRDVWKLTNDDDKRLGAKIRDAETWKIIPFFGKHYYWWFGGGRLQSEKFEVKNFNKTVRGLEKRIRDAQEDKNTARARELTVRLNEYRKKNERRIGKLKEQLDKEEDLETIR